MANRPETVVVFGLTPDAWKRAMVSTVLVVAVLLPFLVSDFRTFQFTLVMIWAIAVLGLNIVTGFSGQFSLGHGAFFAVGAYTAAIMMDHWEVPYYLCVPVAGLVALTAGFAFGFAAGRLAGHYLALATFALAVAVPQILKYDPLEEWTGGVQGISLLKPDAPFGLPLNPDEWLYYFVLFITVVLFVCAGNLLRGRTGRAMMAIRDQPIAAKTMGVNVSLYKALTFGVSAMYTGIGGALYAIVIQFVSPDSFFLFVSIFIFVGMVVGGMASIYGAIYGGLFILFVPNIAEEITKAAPGAIFGVIMIAFAYLVPFGVAGFARIAGARIVRKWGVAPNGRASLGAESKQTLGGE